MTTTEHLAAACARLARRCAELKDFRRMLPAARARAEKAEAAMAEAERARDLLGVAVDAARADLDKELKTCDKLIYDLSEARSRATQAQTELAAVTVERDRLRAELKSAEERFGWSAVVAERDQLRAEINAGNDAALAVMRERDEARAALDGVQHALSEVEGYPGIAHDMLEMQVKIGKLRQEIEDVRRERDALRSEINAGNDAALAVMRERDEARAALKEWSRAACEITDCDPTTPGFLRMWAGDRIEDHRNAIAERDEARAERDQLRAEVARPALRAAAVNVPPGGAS